jgi:hypothetical protein
MDSLIADFLQLPEFVIYGLIGAVTGAVAALVTSPIKSKVARGFLPVLCAIVAINLASPHLNDLRERYGFIKVMNDLKDQRLFAVLLRYHPEAEDQLRDGFKRIILETPNDQVAAAA